uniref:Translation initiation factor eIF2B subunit beta n=1 Tax=Anopheles stephensi TaxID=30069 RepID=A0A182YEI2_ANOST
MKELGKDSSVLPVEGIAEYIQDVRLRKITGSLKLATRTLQLLMDLVSKKPWTTAEELLSLIRTQGRFLAEALPHDIVVANTIRRVMKIVREEYDSSRVVHFDDGQSILSLHKLVTQAADPERDDYSKPMPGLKNALVDHLSEIETELETTGDSISAQAAEHIHSAELIMTIGYSHAVEKFLRKAAETRPIEVVVVECAPDCRGQQLAANLGRAKIQTTLISDAAIFAIMSRINKIIIGTHSVLANGGLQAVCGTYSLALSAKHFSVPVIVLAPTYKLTPVHLCNYEQGDFNILGNTEAVLPFKSLASRFTKAYNPLFDYVPPELVTLFVTNNSKNSALASLTATYTDSENEEERRSDDESPQSEGGSSVSQIRSRQQTPLREMSESSGTPVTQSNTASLPFKSAEPSGASDNGTPGPPRKKALRLVSYIDDTIVDTDEENNSPAHSDREEPVESEHEPEPQRSPSPEKVDRAKLYACRPEPKGKCSQELQDKIAALHERMKNSNMDTNRIIQERKEFRNPSIYEKLIHFCDINELGTNYPAEIFDPFQWGKESYYEELAKAQKIEMEKVEKARKEATKTEIQTGVKRVDPDESKKRKSKWDQPGVLGAAPGMLGAAAAVAMVNALKPAGILPQTLTTTATGTKGTVISAFGSLPKKPKV